MHHPRNGEAHEQCRKARRLARIRALARRRRSRSSSPLTSCRTTVAPSWDDIGRVAAIAAIRTLPHLLPGSRHRACTSGQERAIASAPDAIPLVGFGAIFMLRALQGLEVDSMGDRVEESPKGRITSQSDSASISTELASRRTGMSFQRTRMSADRTLMSVIRTSLSLIWLRLHDLPGVREAARRRQSHRRTPRRRAISASRWCARHPDAGRSASAITCSS